MLQMEDIEKQVLLDYPDSEPGRQTYSSTRHQPGYNIRLQDQDDESSGFGLQNTSQYTPETLDQTESVVYQDSGRQHRSVFIKKLIPQFSILATFFFKSSKVCGTTYNLEN